MQGAGLPHGSVRHHFGSRAGLLAALVDAVRRCWASLYAERALTYLARQRGARGDEVEGRGLAGDDVGPVEDAEGERAEAVRVARCDEGVAHEEDHGVGPAGLPKRVDDPVDPGEWLPGFRRHL